MSSSWSFCCSLPPPRNFILPPTMPKLISSKHTTSSTFSISHSQTLDHRPHSSTSSTPTLEEDDQQLQTSSLDDLPLDSQPPPTSIFSTGGCKACGREEVERGCNGEGRIQGGIATFPGLGWWPIKAYRPCPGFVASGGRYRRTGQSMDEVAFGKGQREASVQTDAKANSRKKKQGPSKDEGTENSNSELGDAII